MRITDVETTILRLDAVVANGDGFQDMLLVRVHTDAGITGIGEAHTMPQALKAIIDAPISQLVSQGLRGVLIGEDPRRIAYLWNKMYRATLALGRRGLAINAISAIDIALWDILGKSLGTSISMILGGGFRQSVRAYASDLLEGDESEIVTRLKAFRERGFTAAKLGWGVLGRDLGHDVQLVARIREELGPDFAIMLDAGTALPYGDASKLARALARYDVTFFEEPLSPDDIPGYRRLTTESPVAIAAGEKATTAYEFVDLVDRAHLKIIQPDLARCGGISEALKIATFAQLRSVAYVPHSWASDILVAATLHVLASIPDAPWVEVNVMENPLRRLLVDPLKVIDGELAVPEGPGLGIEVNEAVVEHFAWNAQDR